MTNQESLRHIDELINDKKKQIVDTNLLEIVELMFVRNTLVIECMINAIKNSFDSVFSNYKNQFEEISEELKALRKDLGYPNGK